MSVTFGPANLQIVQREKEAHMKALIFPMMAIFFGACATMQPGKHRG
jgi:hypothetical protein